MIDLITNYTELERSICSEVILHYRKPGSIRAFESNDHSIWIEKLLRRTIWKRRATILALLAPRLPSKFNKYSLYLHSFVYHTCWLLIGNNKLYNAAIFVQLHSSKTNSIFSIEYFKLFIPDKICSPEALSFKETKSYFKEMKILINVF